MCFSTAGKPEIFTNKATLVEILRKSLTAFVKECYFEDDALFRGKCHDRKIVIRLFSVDTQHVRV